MGRKSHTEIYNREERTMDKMRMSHIAEMQRLRTAIGKTKSQKLKNDYTKSLRRMENELKEYDRYKAS